MQDNFFRDLNLEEIEQFKQWAKENFVPNMKVSSLWHPVVRIELERLQADFNKTKENKE